MDDKDKCIQTLRQDLAKWKNRTLEAAFECCERCRYICKARKEEPECHACRIIKIAQEAQK